MNRRGLGRGLDALIPGNYDMDRRESLSEVDVADITPNRFQPRTEFDQERLSELAASVKLYGVLQPIVVRRQGERYELVAGERRWRASQMVGLKTIPAVIRDYTDTEMTAVALVENLQRENLNPIEEALAYRKLIDEFGFTQEEVSQKVGKSRSFIANVVRLLNLPVSVQAYVSRGTMSPGQARPLLVLATAELQLEAAEEIVTHSLTARDAEELARKWSKKPAGKDKGGAQKLAGETEIEERLSLFLGTRVRIMSGAKAGGTIVIEYFSGEELQRIVEKVEGAEEEGAFVRKPGRGTVLSV